MGMSVDTWLTKSIEIWNGEKRVPSQREYVIVEDIQATQEVERGYGYPERNSVRIDLYLDLETGLVVFDVAAYEAWLEKRGWYGTQS